MKMHPLQLYANLIQTSANTYMKQNIYYILANIFIHYVYFKLQKLLQTNLQFLVIRDKVLKYLVNKYSADLTGYIDYSSCILGNIQSCEQTKPTWSYICCNLSYKKYKVLIIPIKDIPMNVLLISDTMRHNIETSFRCKELPERCCLLPIQSQSIEFATEARVQLISNSQACGLCLIDTVLKNYFSEPKFLRTRDVFIINVKEYGLDLFYSAENSIVPTLHFKVKSLKVRNNRNARIGCYVMHGETTLVQEESIYSYLPRMHGDIDLKEFNLYGQIKESVHDECCPVILSKTLNQLETCILPFVKRDFQLNIKPIFLMRGPPGSGKSTVIRICAKKLGMNLVIVDFADIHSSTSAQSETRLHITLQNAKRSMPCIVYLNNIHVFGKNSEGQKDERIISSFTASINALYNKNLQFPIIMVATSNNSDLQPELMRIFIETIQVEQFTEHTRATLISHLLENKGWAYQVDLLKIARLCSDYNLEDIKNVVSCAKRIHCKMLLEGRETELILMEHHFLKAHEYIQSIHSNTKGVPRVPKVHWDDIGGLVELKHEIIRRIQLPLLSSFGFGQSGLLLYGPPGTGKTLLAKAVATEYQLQFLSVKGPEILNMYVGQSEENIREIFDQARSAAPCIIFFDELDSLAPNRGRSGDSGGVMDRVVSQLLAEMDGLEESTNIFIIGATNRPDLIDPALLRPGRFDKLLYVGIHTERSSQLSVLKALTRKFALLEKGAELEKVIDLLPNHVTGADLYAVSADAWLHATRRALTDHDYNLNYMQNAYDSEDQLKTITVELQDFSQAAGKLVPSITKEEAQRYEKMHLELSSR